MSHSINLIQRRKMCVLVNNHSHAELELCYSLWLLYLYTHGRKLEFTIFFTYTRHYFLNHYLEWENFFNSNMEDILYIIHPRRVFRLTQVKSSRNHFDSNLNDFVLFSLEDLIKLSLISSNHSDIESEIFSIYQLYSSELRIKIHQITVKHVLWMVRFTL